MSKGMFKARRALVPNRILREGILTSPRIAKLGWAEEVFYRRLHSVVDDFGRYYADHGMLRAACYPRQLNKVSDSDVGKWLRGCVDAALVRVYQVDGEDYLHVLDFNQQVRAKKSKFPDVPSTCAADAKQPTANAHLDVSVSVSEVVDEKRNSAAPDGVSLSVWNDYLKTRGKKLTDTGLKGLQREAAKAGYTLQQALETACERGWRGFKAEWVQTKEDKARTTVPSKPDRDPALVKLEEDARKATPIPLAELERMARIRQGVKA
jgi:hypothetical protein